MGWAWPWMLLWLPAVILPLVIFRRSILNARTVPWGPIDLVAAAARRSHLSRRGFSLPLVLLRSLMLLLAIGAAARPFLGGPAADDETTERIAAGDPRGGAVRRIVIVEPDLPAAAADQPEASAIRLAITALCGTGGFSFPNPRLPAILPAVDAVQARNLAATVGDAPVPAAGLGTLIILSDGAVPADFAAADGAAARLTRAVDRGAAVLVLLGPRNMAEPDRSRLSTWLEKICGLSIEGRLEGAGRRIEVEPLLAGVSADDPQVQPFVTLAGPSVARFADLFVRRRDAETAATVLARTVPDGRPLVVEARAGRGRVCVAALPFTLPQQDAWSDLAAWPAFVPFVDRLAARLVNPRPEGTAAPVASLEHSRTANQTRWKLFPARLLLLAALAIAVLDPLLSASSVSRTTMAGLWPARLAILGTLLAMLAADRSAAFADKQRDRTRRVAFLVDVSPSMGTADVAPSADGTERLPRLQALVDAIAHSAGPRPIDAIRSRGWGVSVAAVGPELLPLDAADPLALSRLVPLPPAVRASRLGDAIESTVASGDDPPAAVVVVSDGNINAGAGWQRAARAAAARGIPLIAIPVGGDGTLGAVSDTEASGDVVIDATLPRLVWRGEPVAIAVEADGSADGPDRVPVVLADRDGRPLAEGLLRHDGDGSDRLVGRIEWTPQQSGRQTLLVRAGSAADDGKSGTAFDANSAIPTTVISTMVIDDPVRVFLVDAVPRFEFRFLEHLLAGDRRFEVESCLLDRLARRGGAPADGPTRGRLASPPPDTPAGWSRFDAVVLGDLAGHDIAGGTAEALLEAARDDGIGIAWLPGRRWRSRPPENEPLTDLLPAVSGIDSAVADGTPRRLRVLPAGPQSGWLPEPVATAAAARTRDLFDSVGPVQLRPTARVLAVSEPSMPPAMHGAPASPAIVLDQYGRAPLLGHCFETWRLRGPRGGYEDYWKNALLRLAEWHVLARHASATLEIQPRQLTSGDSVRIEVAPTTSSVDLSGWLLEHRGPDGGTQRLDLPPLQVRLEQLEPGWHTVTVVPPAAGDRPSRSSSPPAEVSRDFLVTRPVEERPGPPARTAAMQAAAVACGGAVVPLDAIGTLADTIDRSTTAAARAARPRSEPLVSSMLVSNLLMLALLASCAIEWSLRAGKGMH